MTDKKHGGPAFPFEYHNQTSRTQECFATDNTIAPGASAQYGGMSLRDYFAAKAMQAFIERGGGEYKWVAQESYAMADAMLAARSA